MAQPSPQESASWNENSEVPKEPPPRPETREERAERIKKLNDLLDLQPDWNSHDLFNPVHDRHVQKDHCYAWHEILQRCVNRVAKFGEEEVGNCDPQWDKLLNCCRYHRYSSKICYNKYRHDVIELEQSILDAGGDPDADIFNWWTKWSKRDRTLWWHIKYWLGFWKDPLDD